jgi:hypothetical protein
MHVWDYTTSSCWNCSLVRTERVITGLCISSCKKFDLRKRQFDSENRGQTEVRPRFSRKIRQFEGSISEVWWRLEIENHTVGSKGWTLVRLLVQLKFNPGSTAVRLSKVEQISTGCLKFHRTFFNFCWWFTSRTSQKSLWDLSQTSVELRLEVRLSSKVELFWSKMNLKD